MSDKLIDGKSAVDLFPDLFKDKIESPASFGPTPVVDFEKGADNIAERYQQNVVIPPPPVPLQTLLQNFEDEANKSADYITRALVYCTNVQRLQKISSFLKKNGLSVTSIESDGFGIEVLQKSSFLLVIRDMDPQSYPSDFHTVMCRMPMDKRRRIFYVLLGPQLHTLYNIEALSLSANLTINHYHLDWLLPILHTGYKTYYNFFAPMMEELRIHLPRQLF